MFPLVLLLGSLATMGAAAIAGNSKKTSLPSPDNSQPNGGGGTPSPITSTDPKYKYWLSAAKNVVSVNNDLAAIRYSNGTNECHKNPGSTMYCGLKPGNYDVVTGSADGIIMLVVNTVDNNYGKENGENWLNSVPLADKRVLAAYAIGQKTGSFTYYGVNGGKPTPYAYLLTVHPTTLLSTVLDSVSTISKFIPFIGSAVGSAVDFVKGVLNKSGESTDSTDSGS